MEYRNLGTTGLRVSELCMGTMQFGWTADEETSYKVLDATWEGGINFIDTADVYSRWADGNEGGVSEEIIGKWMRKQNIPRHEIVIATKVRASMSDDVNDQGLSRQHIFKAVEDSLRRLQTDYIDLYQSHSDDPLTPIEETLRAFDDLISQGKVRYIGASNYPAWKMVEALWTSEHYNLAQYVSIQPHYNIVHRAEYERELQEMCESYGVGVIPYAPLAGGFLTGKYRKDQDPPEDARGKTSPRIKNYSVDKNWDLLDLMGKIGKDKGGHSISQIALAWQLSMPHITSPIIGPRNLAQLEDNLGAMGLRLTAEEMEQLNEASAWE